MKSGNIIFLNGSSSAGKTTLVNLLMRFYEIGDGAILIDGVDTRDMTRDDLRRTFGMVLQDTWLFKGTIRENLAYGREGATDAEIFIQFLLEGGLSGTATPIRTKRSPFPDLPIRGKPSPLRRIFVPG